MKKLLLLLPVLYGSLGAQTPSCCQMPATEQNRLLASNSDFVASHLAPLPFKLAEEKGQMERFTTKDGTNGRAYVVRSKTRGDKVLFVFHEWWGLNDYIKQEAEKLQAALGNVDVYAIDLYDGEIATTPAQAQKLMSELKEERARAIIDGAIRSFAPGQTKIASIGWCMGGTWSMQSTLMEGEKAIACVMYYGMPENEMDKLKTLNCDVLGIFGMQDKYINPDVVKRFEENMKKAGKKLMVHSYDAPHAFANPSNPKYDRVSAADAYKKALAYLRERLK